MSNKKDVKINEIKANIKATNFFRFCDVHVYRTNYKNDREAIHISVSEINDIPNIIYVLNTLKTLVHKEYIDLAGMSHYDGCETCGAGDSNTLDFYLWDEVK